MIVRFHCFPVIAGVIFASCVSAQASNSPEWVAHVIAEGYPNQTAVAADFTGDGWPDVITGDITPNKERIILYAAPDWKPVVLATGIRTIHAVAMDVDGDGKQDFVASRFHPGLIYWLERPKNPLQDTWNTHSVDDATLEGVDGVHGLYAGDVDRDGKLDLVVSSGQPKGAFPDSLAWFRIPPNPRSATAWERYIVADRDATGLNHYIGFGDVNGDGKPDVASAAKDSPGGNWLAWWEQGKDARQPWKKHLIASGQTGATNILIADLNGDRKPDFVASRGHGIGVTWYSAPRWEAHSISSDLKGAHSLAVGDIDRDGDSDVITVAKDSRVAAWFENDGRGNFKQHRIAGDQSAYDVRVVDMDRDGDLDVLVAGFESNNVVLYENRVRGK